MTFIVKCKTAKLKISESFSILPHCSVSALSRVKNQHVNFDACTAGVHVQWMSLMAFRPDSTALPLGEVAKPINGMFLTE